MFSATLALLFGLANSLAACAGDGNDNSIHPDSGAHDPAQGSPMPSGGASADAGDVGEPLVNGGDSGQLGEPDEPDDDGVDSNGDGIDGDKARAVFVDTRGGASARGTMTDPVSSIQRAVDIAKLERKDVYVCSQKFAENVSISDVSVGIYGGYDCEHGWKRSSNKAIIAPASGVAVTVRNAPSRMLLSQLEIVAPDANSSVPSQSSVAVFAYKAGALELRRCDVRAGAGAAGKAAAAPNLSLTGRAESGADGQAAINPPDWSPTREGGAGGFRTLQKASDCPMPGGRGGSGSNAAQCVGRPAGVACQEYKAGSMWLIAREAPPGSAPQSGVTPSQTGRGGDPGKPGAAHGAIAADGYQSLNYGLFGGRGGCGTPGAGGGGAMGVFAADSIHTLGGGGGQGGAGGVGGPGGVGGGAGGASIAVAALESRITLTRCNLRTDTGGNGVSGGAGSPGQQGGLGGVGGASSAGAQTVVDKFKKNSSDSWTSALIEYYVLAGLPGGTGGQGGTGGPGGAGGGGPSVGVFAQASSLELIESDIAPGRGGAGGKAIAFGDAPQKDGANGVSADVLLLDKDGKPVQAGVNQSAISDTTK